MSNNGDEETQIRRSRSREVSSRYMLPTISSAASASASPNSNEGSPRVRRPSSPNSRGRNGSETPLRSQSIERRRSEKGSRFRGPAGLWPSTALNNDMPVLPTLADHLGIQKKIQSANDDNNTRGRRSGEPWKENIQRGVLTSSKSTGYMNVLNKSLDTNTKMKGVNRSSSLNLPGRSFRNDDIKPAALLSPARASLDLGKHLSRRGANEDEEAVAASYNSNPLTSDGIEITVEEEENVNTTGNPKRIIKGSYVPARFLQDTLSRLRRMSDAGHLPGNNQRGTKPFPSSSASSSSWAVSPARDITGNNNHNKSECDPDKSGGRMSSMINLGMEMLKGKAKAKRKLIKAAAQEEVLHQLRLLHNRFLQWRFVNARAQLAHQTQATSAQDSIYRVWLKTSELRNRVVIKRIHFYRTRHQHKLNRVVAAHAAHLEDWAGLKEEHEWAVRGTMERLDAATVKLPLVAGAKADIRAVKQVVSFAVDVMHGIRANATKFLVQAEKVDALLPELAETVGRERALLHECVELLAGLNSLEVEERSLRTQLVQLHQQKSCV